MEDASGRPPDSPITRPPRLLVGRPKTYTIRTTSSLILEIVAGRLATT